MIRKLIRAATVMTILGLAGVSCVTDTTIDTTGGDGGGGGGGSSPTQVTVRVINGSSNLAVDVQLYASGQAAANVDTDFFIPANQQVAGVGFAGTGLVEPGRTDEIVLSCESALLVGTLGGRFVNGDTGEQVGTGTRYVFSEGSQFPCGSTITFTYLPSGSGFATRADITPPG